MLFFGDQLFVLYNLCIFSSLSPKYVFPFVEDEGKSEAVGEQFIILYSLCIQTSFHLLFTFTFVKYRSKI